MKKTDKLVCAVMLWIAKFIASKCGSMNESLGKEMANIESLLSDINISVGPTESLPAPPTTLESMKKMFENGLKERGFYRRKTIQNLGDFILWDHPEAQDKVYFHSKGIDTAYRVDCVVMGEYERFCASDIPDLGEKLTTALSWIDNKIGSTTILKEAA